MNHRQPYSVDSVARRRRLSITVLAAFGLLLGACSGTSGSPVASGDQGSVGGELDFLSWEGYDLPDIMTPWLEENGVTLTPTYPGNHDEIQAKLLAGDGGGIDIFTYYQGYKDLYSQLEILTPLDESRLPNLDGLFPEFASDLGNFWVNSAGERVGLPWTWSINALTYDSAAVDEPESYYDLLEPAAADKVVVVDDPLGAFTIGAKILGYDIATLTPDQEAEVADLLGQIIAQAKTVSPSYGDATSLLVSGEAAYIYPGWAPISNFAADAGKDTVRMTIPVEGGMVTTDAWAIPPGADNVDTAYAWMNETIDAAINAAASDYLIAGTVVEESVPLLSEASRATYPFYDDLSAVLSGDSLFGIPPQESDEFMTYAKMVELWTGLKAGS